MAIREYLSRQVDFTTEGCVIPAALNQGFDTLQPDSDIGLIIWSELAPDTSTYPAIKKFMWVATNSLGAWTGAVYLWKETDWQLLNLANGQLILPGTIDISSFSTDGSMPQDIIQVNALGDGYQFVNLVDAIPANSIDLTKLVATPANNGQIPLVVGGVWTYSTLNTALIVGLIANNSLPITKLTPGLGKQVIRTKADATAVEWVEPLTLLEDNSIPITKLSPGTGNAGKIATVNTDGTAVAWLANTATRTQVKQSTVLPVPTAGTSVEYIHELGVLPTTFEARLVCTTANNGFVLGDVIPYTSVTNNAGPTFQLLANITKITLTQNTSAGTREFFNATTGDLATFTPGDWSVRIQVTLTT